MINAVSERIRNIIKIQEQPQTFNLGKSRQKSNQFLKSIQKSNKYSKSIYNDSSNKYVEREQISPFQGVPLDKQSQKSVKNISNPVLSGNQEQIMQKIKQNILQIVYPMISQLNKKIKIMAESQNIVNSLIQQMQNNLKQIKIFCLQNQQASKNTFRQESYSQRRIQNLLDIQQQILKLKEDQMQLMKKIDKINNSGQRNKYSTPDLFNTQTKHGHSPHFLSKSPSTTDISYNNINHKCKCEKLVQQILKSQSHLMNQLKYIKHFQMIQTKTQKR